MPWRRKPARWLSYWDGPVNRDAGFTVVIVYCVGPERGGPVCGHNSMLKLADLPDWDWPRYIRSPQVYQVRCHRLRRHALKLERGHQLQQGRMLTFARERIEFRALESRFCCGVASCRGICGFPSRSCWTMAASCRRCARPSGHLGKIIPKAEHDMPEILTAADLLTKAAEGGGPIEFARIAVMQAINRHVGRVFDPSKKDKHWGRRKLKRETL
jgi:hypothetical protein